MEWILQLLTKKINRISNEVGSSYMIRINIKVKVVCSEIQCMRIFLLVTIELLREVNLVYIEI